MATACSSIAYGEYCGCLSSSTRREPRASCARDAASRSEANIANASSARYWARSTRSEPETVRIALITRRYAPLLGGAEKVLGYLARALAREGADVRLLTANPPGLGLPACERVTIGPGSLVIERLPTSRWRFVGTILYMRSLRNYLRTHSIDLFYVSMLKHDAHVAVGVGGRLGVPVVLRPEGAGDTGDLAWQKWGRFGRKIAARCHHADAVVAISSTIERELIEDAYEVDRIVRLPNGVPVPDRPWRPREDWRVAPRAD